MADTTLAADRETQNKVKRIKATASEIAAERAADLANGEDETMDSESFSENLVDLKQEDILKIAVDHLHTSPDKRGLIKSYIEHKADGEL